MTKIETWLPVFPGFYETIFQADIDDELYSQNQDRDEHLPKIEWDDIDMDYKGYEAEVVEQCTAFIEEELTRFLNSVREAAVAP